MKAKILVLTVLLLLPTVHAWEVGKGGDSDWNNGTFSDTREVNDYLTLNTSLSLDEQQTATYDIIIDMSGEAYRDDIVGNTVNIDNSSISSLSFSFYFDSTGNPDMRAVVYELGADGNPSTRVCTGDYVDVSGLSGNNWVDLPIVCYNLDPSQDYFVGWEFAPSGGTIDLWENGAKTDPYAGGRYFRYDGSSWNNMSGWDVAFKVYSGFVGSGSYVSEVRDAGSGNEAKNVTIYFKNYDQTKANVSVYINDTLIQENVTNATTYSIPSGYQTYTIKLELTTTDPNYTPEIEKVVVGEGASGGGEEDTTPPTYSNVGYNTTVAGETCDFHVDWNDNVALHPNGQWIFSWNASGSWANDSAVNFTSTPETVHTQKTLPSAGTYLCFKWYAWDNASNFAETATYCFTTTSEDETPPSITIHSPLNATYAKTTIDLNVSANEEISAWLYNLNDGGNTSFTPNTTITATEGANHLEVWANDTAGNWGFSEVYFTVDITPPTIYVFKPENKTYTDTNDIPLEVVASEDIAEWLYDLGSGNVSFTPNTTIYDLANGNYHLLVWAKDLAGNWGLNDSIYFAVNYTAPTPTGAGMVLTCLVSVQPSEVLLCTINTGEENANYSWKIVDENFTEIAQGNTISLGNGAYAIRWEVPENATRGAYVAMVDVNGSYIPAAFEVGRKFDISKDLRGDIMAMPILAFFVFMVGFFIAAQWKNDIVLQIVSGTFGLGLGFYILQEKPFPTDLMNKIAYMMIFAVALYLMVILPAYMVSENERRKRVRKVE